MATTSNENLINFVIDTSELSQSQVRLIRTMNSLLLGVITTDSEAEFFDDSAELMRICASLIKQSNFAESLIDNDIPYADQALEYSVDVLQEQISTSRVVAYDN